MNRNSIVRMLLQADLAESLDGFADSSGLEILDARDVEIGRPGRFSAVGMGFVIRKRHIATCSFVVAHSLALPDDHDLDLVGKTVYFDLPLISSGRIIRGNVVGQSHGTSIIETDQESEGIPEPARLISNRDYESYFDRKVRFLAQNQYTDYYVSGVLYGQVSTGLIQMECNVDIGLGSGGTPVWDIEVSAVVGMLESVWQSKRTAFVIPVSRLSEAWPDIEVEKIARISRRPKPRIFICHANEDTEDALNLYKRLKASGYDPWIDKEHLLPGQQWDYEIKKAVKGADFFLLILSEKSVNKRGYIQKEFKMAVEFMNDAGGKDILNPG